MPLPAIRNWAALKPDRQCCPCEALGGGVARPLGWGGGFAPFPCSVHDSALFLLGSSVPSSSVHTSREEVGLH
jgi:hypothetical protein